ncbi:uncharacterized protein [Atheta coriaria]
MSNACGDSIPKRQVSNQNCKSVICLFENLHRFERERSSAKSSPPPLQPQLDLDDFLVPRFRKEQLKKEKARQKFLKQEIEKQEKLLAEQQNKPEILQDTELEKQIQTESTEEQQTKLVQTEKTSIHQRSFTTDFHFPFKSTSSGNLKVNANQVVYESNRVSVLVADPEHTEVKISDRRNCNIQEHDSNMQREDFTKNSAINAIMKQGLGSSLDSVLMGKIGDAPIRKEKEASEYENKATHEILEPELNLSRLGYSATESIDWVNVVLPEKKNLYLELYARITNFTNADCKVYIDNEEFNCHLLVLQCYSEVFHTYVAVKKVELPSDKCSPASFAFIYEWMITGDPSYRDLNRENVLDIFNAAKYLKIKDLIEQCWAFIDNPLVFAEDTAFLLYIDAKEKNLPEVRDLMLPRIEKFYLMLVSSEDWLRLDMEDVMAFLSSNYICVNCEMEVFMSAVRWLKQDWENRDKFKHQVLSCVRFGNVAPWQLVDIKRNPDNPEFRDLAKDPEICKMIDDGLAFVIIKYWYGQQNEDYQHWNSILALKEPPTRNWSGTEKTYFTYREFLIYLDVYRRNLMIIKSNKVDEKVREVSPRPSRDRMEKMMERAAAAKVPTMDEFMRGGGAKPPARAKFQLRYAPCNSARMTPRDGFSPRIPRLYRLTPHEAVCTIEKAYLRYKMRKKIPGLANRLEKSLKKRDSIMRIFQNSRNRRVAKKASKTKSPRFKNDPYVLRVTPRVTPDFDQVPSHTPSISGDFYRRERDFLPEGSLYHLEHESVIVFGGINVHSKYGIGRNTGKDIYRYLPVQNIWEFVGELPAPRTHHSVAYLNGRIYIVGGSDPREDDPKGKFLVVNTVWSFDPVKRAWFSEGGLNMRRKNFGLVVFGQYMYAIGGQDKNSRVTNTIERYNPSTGCWQYVASMRHPRMGCACAKFDNKIWVGGGMCGSAHQPLTDFVECYDINTNQWTDMPRLRLPRCFASFSAINNNLYVIAGAGRNSSMLTNTVSLSSVDIWNTQTNTWEEHAQMEVARHGHTTAYLGTQMLIIGGVTTVYMRSLSSIECFCTSRGTWIRGMSSLPNCLTGHATCTLPPAMML